MKTADHRPIDWKSVRRVLVVRLRSIGDTVLSTPSLIALKRFVPAAKLDILLEDWVAPVLEGFDAVDHVLTFKKDDLRSRLSAALRIRREKYDVVFNLHGGTTATFFVAASGAPHRVGFAHYRYRRFYNHLLTSSADFWGAAQTHSAEQQLALPGFVGVPVDDRPKSRLSVTESAAKSVAEKLKSGIDAPSSKIALFHPAAAFASKQWATENFARVADALHAEGWRVVAVAAGKEREVLMNLESAARVPIAVFDDLTLPELTALAARAGLFVGNDSGIAHIAAAVGTPLVVIFGSSNIDHWRPWTNAPHEVVSENFPCRPCPGQSCREFGSPRCIQNVRAETVLAAVERVLGRRRNS